jgi:hypothetical protein
MNSGGSPSRIAAVRAIGGGRNAARAEQLRALGRSDRTIARQLGVEREAVARWFEIQDRLVSGADLTGVP